MRRTFLLLAAAGVFGACAHGAAALPKEMEPRLGLERREGAVYLRGEPVDALNVGERLRSMLSDIRSDYRLDSLNAQLLEPSGANFLAFPEVQLDVAVPESSGGPAYVDELARAIAQAVYRLTYPSLKRGVSVSMYRKPASGNPKFAGEWLVRPGGGRLQTRNIEETPLNDKRRLR
jgi:hypothetical protein